MYTSTHQPLDNEVQILQVAVPHIVRAYPPPVSHNFSRNYSTFYSQFFLDPPREQGAPGDFFIGLTQVFVKDEGSIWKVAHFNRPVSHPCRNDMFLCYDGWGPLWTRSPLPSTDPIPGLCPISVSVHFYSTLALYQRQQIHRRRGNSPNDPISIDD